MASFTDSVPQFTPYRPEFPVEPALMVGLQKEGDFLENVKRVQGYVSTLKGFDIVKPETRQYLEGKLGEMRNAVNSVSGDFSDQRLINAIGGLAGKISKDPIVENGVLSTMAFRKGQADIEQSKKDGKYSVENEWDFMNEASNWLNDGDYSSKFDHQYTPYRDVRKKVMDVIKDLGANEYIDQLPFVTDSKGNVMIDEATGKPIINHAIVEKHYKGKSADRIINAITASLDSGDYNQLAISGRYNLKDVSPMELQGSLKEFYDNKRMAAINAVAELTIDKLINNNDPQYQKDIDDKIEGYNNELARIQSDYDGDLNTLVNSPDAIRSKLYVGSFLNGISSAFATEEKWTKYVDNPFFNNFMEEERFKLDKWWKEEDLKLRKASEERQWFEAMNKAEKSSNKTTKGENELSYSPTNRPVDTDINKPTELTFRDETNSLIDKKYEILENIVTSHAGKEFENWKNMKKTINDMGYSTPDDVFEKNKRTFLESTFKKLRKAWDERKDMPQAVEELVTQVKDLDSEIETRQASLRNIKDKADKSYPNVTALTEGVNSQFVKDLDGKKKEYTPDAMIDMIVFLKGNEPFSSAEEKNSAEASSKRLSQKLGYNPSLRNIIDIRNMIGQSKDWKKAEKNIEDKQVLEKNKFVNDELIKTGMVGNPQGYALNMEKSDDKNRVSSFLTDYANEAKTTGTNVHPDFDRDKLFAAIASKEGFRASVIRTPSTSKYGEDKFEVEITNDKGGKITKMYVTPQQAEQLTGRDFVNKTSKVIDRLRYSATGTTNYESSSLTGKFASSAFLTRDDFPNVQVPIKADVSKSSQDGKYFITLYTQNETGDWISKEVRAPNGMPGRPNGLTIEQVESFLLNMNDTYLKQLFNK